jgi:predicted RNase H-like HicB family nuclease
LTQNPAGFKPHVGSIPTSGTNLSDRIPITMKKQLLQVVIEPDEDGVYVVSCPALQGCYTQGDTYEEAIKNIKGVIQMCLEELKEEKKKVDLKPSCHHFDRRRRTSRTCFQISIETLNLSF